MARFFAFAVRLTDRANRATCRRVPTGIEDSAANNPSPGVGCKRNSTAQTRCERPLPNPPPQAGEQPSPASGRGSKKAVRLRD